MTVVREGRDRHRWAGPLAAAGLVAGVLVAVLGLPPLDLHGPLHYAGVMGPLCGGTRGVHALLRGDLAAAWAYNPVVYLLVPGAALALARAVVGRTSGGWVNLRVHRGRPLLVAGLCALVALVVNQQAHAELLRTSADSGRATGLLLYAAAAATGVAYTVVLVWRRRRAAGRAAHGAVGRTPR
ncbi:DUF2752 domain-containing protein [Streptomyces sp. MAR4 CNX-425]|uniref:DUF2752 domain-containing protein n=1 Tax=Streptomyces sp. MAR4 CNX-425 TaxID=3406343 RepID=UPI003B5133F3